MKAIHRLTIFRTSSSTFPTREWRVALDGEDISWHIVNPSGCDVVDQAYEGMGEVHVITPEQAQGEKRTALINCARYTARLEVKSRDWDFVIPENVDVVIR